MRCSGRCLDPDRKRGGSEDRIAIDRRYQSKIRQGFERDGWMWAKRRSLDYDKVAHAAVLGCVGLAKHGVVLSERSTERVACDDNLLDVGVCGFVEELVDKSVEGSK